MAEQSLHKTNAGHPNNNCRRCCRIFRYLLLIAIVASTVLNYLQIFNITDISRALLNTRKTLEINEYLIDTPGCRIPKFDPFHPTIAYYYVNVTNELWKCHRDSYLIVEGDRLFLNTTLVQRDFNTIEVDCYYQSIKRPILDQYKRYKMDRKFYISEKVRLTFDSPIKEEFLRVTCYDGYFTMIFEDYLALVALKPEVEAVRAPAANEFLSETPLNVLLLAVDSVSKLNFIRQFPKTYEFLRNVLKPFEFHGHTKVADNTHVNIVPLLTGYFLSEYRSMENVSTTYFDDLDFIWKDFADLGYRTFYSEDVPYWGTFTFNKIGFFDQPTDYYFRPLVLAIEDSEWRARYGSNCCGHTSEPEYHFDYLLRFLRTMDSRPFFAFTFISRASHDSLNGAGHYDDPTNELLHKLHDSGVLNRTVLIFFSDHGIRFGGILNTYIGKIEERMPFMFQHYPKWFLEKYPDIAANLTTNQRRLTTPFDVHKTLMDILMVSLKLNQGEKPVLIPNNDDLGHGRSLFKKLPASRTCTDANIHPHWCTCHDRKEVPVTDPRVVAAAEAIIQTINDWTSNSSTRKISCAKLRVDYIIDAYVTPPSTMQELQALKNEKLDFDWERFRNVNNDLSKEEQGPLQSSDIKWSSETYLVTVRALPGGGIFESTLMRISGEFIVLGDISRLNRYGDTSWCVSSPILKKYCYCTFL